jgi:IS5 family transposase
MKQMTFADAEYAGKRKQPRKELFLIEMDRVVPCKGLITLIEPYYPKGDGGRPACQLIAMLRVHLLSNWFGYSDPAPVRGAEPGAHPRRNHDPQFS